MGSWAACESLASFPEAEQPGEGQVSGPQDPPMESSTPTGAVQVSEHRDQKAQVAGSCLPSERHAKLCRKSHHGEMVHKTSPSLARQEF